MPLVPVAHYPKLTPYSVLGKAWRLRWTCFDILPQHSERNVTCWHLMFAERNVKINENYQIDVLNSILYRLSFVQHTLLGPSLPSTFDVHSSTSKNFTNINWRDVQTRNVVNNVDMLSYGHHDKMARTKTNTQNDTKTLTTSWRNSHLEKKISWTVYWL